MHDTLVSLRTSGVFRLLLMVLAVTGVLAFATGSAGAQEQVPTITITTEAPDNPDKVFRYDFRSRTFAPGPNYIEQKHGETTTIDLAIGNWRINYEEAGWAELVVCSTNGGPEAEVRERDDDARIFLGTSTQSAECTFTHLNAGFSSLTLALESDDPQDSISFEPQVSDDESPIEVAVGQPQTWEYGAMHDFLFYGGFGRDNPGSASCVDDNGGAVTADELSVSSYNIIGRLPAGSDVVCTFTRLSEFKTIPVTLTTFGYDGPIEGQFSNDVSEESEFLLSSGESWTGEAIVGNGFDFYFSGPGWDAVLDNEVCMSDNGKFETYSSYSGDTFSGELPYNSDLSALTLIECEYIARDSSTAFGIFPTVSCLAGNGRIDVNVWNPHRVAREFTLTVGSLSPRVFTIDGKDWGRRPITGRPDGPIEVRLEWLGGEVLLDTTLDVACDMPEPPVSGPEVQVINACRDGLGFIAWQFDNPTDADRVYIISIDNDENIPNRSTTAASFGQSVRGLSGRPNGGYDYSIWANGELIRQDTIVVKCEQL